MKGVFSGPRGKRMGTRRGRRKQKKEEAEFPLLKAAGCIGLIALSALALVWPHLEMVKIGYELARLEAERNRLAQERRVLRVEAAALRQLDRIEAIARGKLKMVFPRPDQVIYVRVRPGS